MSIQALTDAFEIRTWKVGTLYVLSRNLALHVLSSPGANIYHIYRESPMQTHSDTFDALLVACQELLPRLQSRFAAYQKENFPERSPEFFCLELCGEVGELANLEKKQWKGMVVKHEQFADEAADALIALVNYTNARGIDLGSAVKTKLGIIEQQRHHNSAEKTRP